MQHAMRFVPVFGIGLLVTAVGCSSCTSTAPTAGGGVYLDGGAGGHGGMSATTGSGGRKTTGAAGSTASTTDLPDGGVACPGWPGWRLFTEVGADTTVCVPLSKEALPEPFAWDPCPPESGYKTGCRMLRIPVSPDPLVYGASALDLASQPPLLPIWRASTYIMFVVGEVDGPMRTAILDPRAHGDALRLTYASNYQGLRQGKAIVGIRASGSSDEYVVGIDLENPFTPRVLWTLPTQGLGLGTGKTLWSSEDSVDIGITEWGKPWSLAYSGKPTGRQQGFVYHWDDFVVWHDGNYPNSADFRAYTPTKGVYSFIAYPGDPTQGVGGVGTDGQQLVWVHGHDRKPGDDGYPVQDIMVSPFTTDPAKLQPRRVRSHPSKWSLTLPYAVGCGYAAYSPETSQVFVVRLADGWTWNLPHDGCLFPDLNKGFCLDNVLGITCDEVFVYQVAGSSTVARIRLDALGPGQAGD